VAHQHLKAGPHGEIGEASKSQRGAAKC
jgi:hypothetical protein